MELRGFFFAGETSEGARSKRVLRRSKAKASRTETMSASAGHTRRPLWCSGRRCMIGATGRESDANSGQGDPHPAGELGDLRDRRPDAARREHSARICRDGGRRHRSGRLPEGIRPSRAGLDQGVGRPSRRRRSDRRCSRGTAACGASSRSISSTAFRQSWRGAAPTSTRKRRRSATSMDICAPSPSRPCPSRCTASPVRRDLAAAGHKVKSSRRSRRSELANRVRSRELAGYVTFRWMRPFSILTG